MKRICLINILFVIPSLIFAQSSYFGVGFLGGGVLFSNASQNAKLVGYNYGLQFCKTTEITNRFNIVGGLQIRFQQVDNYLNNVDYISNWSSGYKITNVSLHTKFKQVYLEVPFELQYKLNKFIRIGVGSTFNILLNSKIDQTVKGYYSVPEYADQDSILNQSIRSSLMFSELNGNAIFPKVNICPTVSVGLNFDRFNLSGIVSINVIKIPNEVKLFNPYEELRILLLIIYKI